MMEIINCLQGWLYHSLSNSLHIYKNVLRIIYLRRVCKYFILWMYKNKPPICFGKKVAWLVMVKSRVNADCLRHECKNLMVCIWKPWHILLILNNMVYIWIRLNENAEWSIKIWFIFIAFIMIILFIYKTCCI